jgi:hypothetical protein
MSEDEQREEATTEMWKRFQSAFAAGMGKLSLTPVGGGCTRGQGQGERGGCGHRSATHASL